MNTCRTDALKNTRAVYWIIASGLALFFLCAFMYDFESEVPIGFQDGWGKLNLVQLAKFGLLVAVFFLFERYLNRKQRMLAYLAEISFGLFFVHGFFVLMSSRIQQRLGLDNPWLAFLFELHHVQQRRVAGRQRRSLGGGELEAETGQQVVE